jgi:hypothetical protein
MKNLCKYEEGIFYCSFEVTETVEGCDMNFSECQGFQPDEESTLQDVCEFCQVDFEENFFCNNPKMQDCAIEKKETEQ